MNNVKVHCEPVIARDLQPGDLFSILGPAYWSSALNGRSVGESVYIRTFASAEVAGDADEQVYRITIERS